MAMFSVRVNNPRNNGDKMFDEKYDDYSREQLIDRIMLLESHFREAMDVADYNWKKAKKFEFELNMLKNNSNLQNNEDFIDNTNLYNKYGEKYE